MPKQKSTPALRTISNTHWYVLLFSVGAASTAVEIAGLRFLAPVFGSSLPVWGSAIAVVLAGLAIGYAIGGKKAQKDVPAYLVFQYAAFGAALFLWMPALLRISLTMRNMYFETGDMLFIAGALTLSFATLLPPSIVFGIAGPLAVQAEAIRRNQSAGQVSGRISALTTIGSLAGILLPSFITIPLLGTRATVWIFAGAVLLLYMPVLIRPYKHNAATALFIISAILSFFLPHRQDPGVIFAAQTPHQYIHVSADPERSFRTLAFDANLGTQSLFTSNKYTNGYWDYLAALPILLPETEEATSLLVLGAAASTTERQMERLWKEERTFSFTSVELDSLLFSVADIYFDPPKRKTVTADARMFIAADTNQYDIVVLDAYARELAVPFHLSTAEFFQEVLPRISPHGVFAININASSTDTAWVRNLAATVQQSFPHISLLSVPNTCNHIMIASLAPWSVQQTQITTPDAVAPLLPAFSEAETYPQTNGTVLTDNRAPTDMLGLHALMKRGDIPSC